MHIILIYFKCLDVHYFVCFNCFLPILFQYKTQDPRTPCARQKISSAKHCLWESIKMNYNCTFLEVWMFLFVTSPTWYVMSCENTLLTSFQKQIEVEKHRSWAPAVWSYLHAAMSLGKRQHEIWTKGGSGRKEGLIKKDTVKEKPHYTKQKHKNVLQSKCYLKHC